MKRVYKVYISKDGSKPYFMEAVKDNAFYQYIKNGEKSLSLKDGYKVRYLVIEH